ncbi:MAG: ABC transporter permease subunit [Exilispira sp.]|jgi:ABC-type nitrate/sulfonate/bicarbonate transport system permease component|nr:ABC transporter permease subunit [Exilispira sp.]
MSKSNAERRNLIFSIILTFLVFFFGIILKIYNINLALDILISLKRMVIGYILAVFLGFVTAIILSLSKYVYYSFKPILSFLLSIPTITWVPFLLIISGISEKTIVISIFLGSYFAITFNLLEGFRNVNKDIIKASKIMGYKLFNLYIKVYIPASMNNILVGLKLGISYSWRALVGAEMIVAINSGLGRILFVSRQSYNLKLMLILLFFIGIFGYILNRLIIYFIEYQTISKWGYK